jgi:hypothetical protein
MDRRSERKDDLEVLKWNSTKTIDFDSIHSLLPHGGNCDATDLRKWKNQPYAF